MQKLVWIFIYAGMLLCRQPLQAATPLHSWHPILSGHHIVTGHELAAATTAVNDELAMVSENNDDEQDVKAGVSSTNLESFIPHWYTYYSLYELPGISPQSRHTPCKLSIMYSVFRL